MSIWKYSVDKRPPLHLLKAGYICGLSLIALLSVGAHFFISEAVVKQDGAAETINVAGRQRMLSQRTAFFAQVYSDTGSQASQTYLIEAANLMLDQHNALTHMGQHESALLELSPNLQSMYFEDDLDTKVRDFVDAALRVAGDEQQQGDLEYILTKAKQPLLQALDNVVKQYELETEAHVDRLHRTQQMLLVVIIAALILEAILIFRPLVNLVSDYTTRMFNMAMTDELTNVFNRRAWYDSLAREMAISKRLDSQLSVAVIDIDHFKSVNDTHGHDVGDRAIIHVTETVGAGLRGSDIMGRVGGEEFCVLFPSTDEETCHAICDRLRLMVSTTPMALEEGELNLTVSIGVSSLSQDEIADDLVKRADENLYSAKRTGRNKVMSCLDWLTPQATAALA